VQNDPLWNLRHAIAGVAIALLLAVLIAALAGSFVADLFGGGYGHRVAAYGVLLLHVVVGAGVLFVKVAQHEKRPLSAARIGLWLVSLWIWPLLVAARRRG
jgi:L-alanine-DL-glutamate epimerase-like enolase superfamily enzyme